MTDRLAVFDVGSNSARAVILLPGADGFLEVIEEIREPLQLARELDAEGRLHPEAIDRTLAVLADFLAVARGSGATRIFAIGTAALREAGNAADLVARAHQELGLSISIIDGATEARYAAFGAIYGLPLAHGALLDIGGGSLELARFRDRTLLDTWTFPLGALRLTDRFLKHDPPRDGEVAALRDHVRKALVTGGVPPLGPDEVLTGTGGVIRNLAKIERRARGYPLPRLHGYEIAGRPLQRLVEQLLDRPAARRSAIPGLNPSRADSIIGGALALTAVMEHLGAESVIVSGQGLREGVARTTLLNTLPTAAVVRQAAVGALVARFARWDRDRAAQRVELAGMLAQALDPDAAAPWPELLAHAAYLLDVGASIDFYNRNRQTAALVVGSDLSGFSHIEIARLAALIRVAEDPAADVADFAPLLEPPDARQLRRSATLLALADELQRRAPPGMPGSVACRVEDGVIRVTAPPGSMPWRPGPIATRLRAVFRRDLVIEVEAPAG